jgi:hypothetical protein
MTTIRQQIDELNAKIDIMIKQVLSLREACEHKNVKKKHCADTGNYFADNIYWTEFRCPDCDKFWQEEGSV